LARSHAFCCRGCARSKSACHMIFTRSRDTSFRTSFVAIHMLYPLCWQGTTSYSHQLLRQFSHHSSTGREKLRIHVRRASTAYNPTASGDTGSYGPLCAGGHIFAKDRNHESSSTEG
jgi:hypothetical protein